MEIHLLAVTEKNVNEKTIITGRFTCRSSEVDTDLEVLDNTGCMIQEFIKVNIAQSNVINCQSITLCPCLFTKLAQ